MLIIEFLRVRVHIHVDSRIGPVWNEADYSIQVNKEGYEFKVQVENPRDFHSLKLSHLKLKFLDAENGQSLSDVLVSLSGGDNYRSNNLIDSNGSIDFIGLVCLYFVVGKNILLFDLV